MIHKGHKHKGLKSIDTRFTRREKAEHFFVPRSRKKNMPIKQRFGNFRKNIESIAFSTPTSSS